VATARHSREKIIDKNGTFMVKSNELDPGFEAVTNSMDASKNEDPTWLKNENSFKEGDLRS